MILKFIPILLNQVSEFHRSRTKCVYLQSVHHYKEEEEESGGEDQPLQQEAFQRGERSRGWKQQL